ncbi:hypothetical protein [Sulfurimonas sp.]
MKYFLFLFLMSVIVQASNYVVVANKSLHLKKLKEKELKNIFLKKYTMHNGINIFPINLPPNSAIRKRFEKKILKMSHHRMKTYWMKEHYLGYHEPEQKTFEKLIPFLENKRGAISYTRLDALQKDVDIIFVIKNNPKIVVIANKKLHLKNITPTQAKTIFLKKVKKMHNILLVPVNLAILNKERKVFEKKILQLSRSKLQQYWTQEHALGERPPVNLLSPQSVLSFVKKIDGAIGYIPIDALNDKVDIVYEF